MDELGEKVQELAVCAEANMWPEQRVLQLINDYLKELEAIQETHKDIPLPERVYMKAKILSVREPLDANCEKLAAKAVKLSPKSTKYWNLLGEVCWRKGDLVESKRCFTKALEAKENATSYKSLSMLYRQLPAESPVAHLKMVNESVELAKKAIKLDAGKGNSWFVLGNAYMTMFFGFTHYETHLNQAVRAFEQANDDEFEREHNPDLHHNRGTVYKYTENFDRAIEALRHALVLDPSLTASQQLLSAIYDQLSTTHTQVAKKGELKPKKVDGHVADITAMMQKSSAKASAVPLSELKDGVNEGKVLFAKIVLVLTKDPMPQVLLIVDSAGAFACLTVYNTKDNAIRMGDVVAIYNPTRHDVALDDDEHLGKIEYPSVRVENPTTVERNGRKLGDRNIIMSQLMVQNKAS